MIDRLKQRFGNTIHVVSVQEYFKDGGWVKLVSNELIENQINNCIALGATMISFHATVEELDEESKNTKTVDIYPDVKVD